MSQQARLDYLSKHPGGFDRDFFNTHLITLLQEYADDRGLDVTTMEVVVTLASGEEFLATSVRVALTWVVFFTEADDLVIVPHGEVAKVVGRWRRGAAPRRTMGFTAESIKES